MEKYVICKIADLEEKLSFYDQMIRKASSIEERKKLKEEKYDYAKLAKNRLTVDKQGRVVLTSDFKKYKKLSLVGCGNVLYIEPIEEEKGNLK